MKKAIRTLSVTALVACQALLPTTEAKAATPSTQAFMRLAWKVHTVPFLMCTRSHESSSVAPYYDTGKAPQHGYGAINPNGRYFGAYQFGQTTWNNTARHVNLGFLVGTRPDRAPMFVQDIMALSLYRWQGKAPWSYRC